MSDKETSKVEDKLKKQEEEEEEEKQPAAPNEPSESNTIPPGLAFEPGKLLSPDEAYKYYFNYCISYLGDVDQAEHWAQYYLRIAIASGCVSSEGSTAVKDGPEIAADTITVSPKTDAVEAYGAGTGIQNQFLSSGNPDSTSADNPSTDVPDVPIPEWLSDGRDYAQSAFFNKKSGRMTTGDHWGSRGLETDKDGRMLSSFMDLSRLDADGKKKKRKKVSKNEWKRHQKAKKPKPLHPVFEK